MGVMIDFDCEVSGFEATHNKAAYDLEESLQSRLYRQRVAVDSASRKMKERLGEGPISPTGVCEANFETSNLPSPRVEFNDILDMLLASRESRYLPDIPLHKCSSPIPPNAGNKSYLPVFYVSKDPKMQKRESPDEGIPVRYQGFSKAIVWFSQSNPRYGVVARRMQHQARMKQKNPTSVEQFAAVSTAFFTFFEGFSYVLVDRGEEALPIDKRDICKYVCNDAAKIVQIWPATDVNKDPSPRLSVKREATSSEATISYYNEYEPSNKRQNIEYEPYHFQYSTGLEETSYNEISAFDYTSKHTTEHVEDELLDDFLGDFPFDFNIQEGFY